MMIYQKLDNVEYVNCLGSVITNDARCTREIKYRIVMAKAAFNKKTLFTNKLDLNLRNKLVTCHIRSVALCGAETWTNTWKELKYGAGEEWGRSVGPIV
jgi:hypothetical protein